MTESKPKTFTETEAERFFAAQYFNQTWGLLDKPDRTPDETETLIDYAHASLAHWRKAGTPLHHQRGEWMLSRVYWALGQAEVSLAHARRCKQLTDENLELMQDFDLAFAWECLARAHALAGNQKEAEECRKQAEKAGKAIQDEEDRKIFDSDLSSL